MENDYHNPYDHRPKGGGVKGSATNSDSDQANNHYSDQANNHYEAPSCLVRNPSGSLFIPSSGMTFLKALLYCSL